MGVAQRYDIWEDMGVIPCLSCPVGIYDNSLKPSHTSPYSFYSLHNHASEITQEIIMERVLSYPDNILLMPTPNDFRHHIKYVR